MTIFFRDYLNERLKDMTFRKEYEAAERSEAMKVRIKKKRANQKLRSSTNSLFHRDKTRVNNKIAQKQQCT